MLGWPEGAARRIASEGTFGCGRGLVRDFDDDGAGGVEVPAAGSGDGFARWGGAAGRQVSGGWGVGCWGRRARLRRRVWMRVR